MSIDSVMKKWDEYLDKMYDQGSSIYAVHTRIYGDIESYRSVADAVKKLNVHRANIHRALDDPKKISVRRRWFTEYEEAEKFHSTLKPRQSYDSIHRNRSRSPSTQPVICRRVGSSRYPIGP